jgi:hypothetical protein
MREDVMGEGGYLSRDFMHAYIIYLTFLRRGWVGLNI